MPTATTAPASPPMGFPEAGAAFLDYLDSYRGYSPHTVKAYARDLRWFQEFLAERYPAVGSPGEVHREMVVQYAVQLQGAAALTIRRKLATLASFYGYLQDMGEVAIHPARKLPLPKVAQACPPYLTEEQVRRLLDAAPHLTLTRLNPYLPVPCRSGTIAVIVTTMGRIVIDRERCKACGLCLAFCRQELIRFSDEINQQGFYPAAFTETGKCTGCANCALMCPEVAIKVYR